MTPILVLSMTLSALAIIVTWVYGTIIRIVNNDERTIVFQDEDKMLWHRNPADIKEAWN